MVCSCCGKQKAELHPKKSKLMLGATWLLCPPCTKAKMEPRWSIILYGRSNGAESVADYVKNHRYVGEEISAKELIK